LDDYSEENEAFCADGTGELVVVEKDVEDGFGDI
jgi:hypothetical protein